MVYDRRVARADFNRRHPCVLFEWVWDKEGFDFSYAFGRNGMSFRYGDNDIRLDPPSVGPLNGRRFIGGITFAGAAIDPGDDGADIVLRQLRRIAELSIVR